MVLPRELEEVKTTFSLGVTRSKVSAYVITVEDLHGLLEYKEIWEKISRTGGLGDKVLLGTEWMNKRNCLIILSESSDLIESLIKAEGHQANVKRLADKPYLLTSQLIQDREVFETLLTDQLSGCESDDDQLYLCHEQSGQNMLLWVTSKPDERAICARSKGILIIPLTGQRQYVMVVDLNRCVGCGACEIACREEHNLPPSLSWTSIKKLGPENSSDGLQFYALPMICMHCKDAPCANVCPTKATFRTADGIVSVNEEKCIGCRFCIAACPYEMRVYNPDKRVVQKCNHCLERIQTGIMIPRCVETCHVHAKYFGDWEDLESEIHKVLGRHESRQMAARLRTDPLCQYILRW